MIGLGCKINHHKPNPASDNPKGTITAHEHQRQELESVPSEDQLVPQGTIDNQWDRNGQVKQRKPVEYENSGPLGDGCDSVEDEEEQHQPQDCINSLEGEFGGCKQQREEWDMACNRQRSEGAEVATVLEGDETEWNDDEENGFLMHMPTEEEWCITAEGDRTDKGIPTAWVEPDLDERNLDKC